MSSPYSHGLAILRLASGTAILVSFLIALGLAITTGWAWSNVMEMPVWRQIGLAICVASPIVASVIALVGVVLRRPSPFPERALLVPLGLQIAWLAVALALSQ